MRPSLPAPITILVGVALCLAPPSLAFSHGAGHTSCQEMRPGHIRAHLQEQQHGHVILRTSSSSYLPGQMLTVTVRSSRDFMGFLLQARGVGRREEESGEEARGSWPGVVGSWSLSPPGTHTLGCSGPGDTLTHSDKQLKRNLSFVWRAPDHPLGDIQFYITVVQSYFIYWAGIKSLVVHDGSSSSQNRSDTMLLKRRRPLYEPLEEHPVPAFRAKVKTSNQTVSEINTLPVILGSPQVTQKVDSYKGFTTGIIMDHNAVMIKQPGVVTLNQFDPKSITYEELISDNIFKTNSPTPTKPMPAFGLTPTLSSQTIPTPTPTIPGPHQITPTPSQTTIQPSQTNITTPNKTNNTKAKQTMQTSRHTLPASNRTGSILSHTMTPASQTDITTPSQNTDTPFHATDQLSQTTNTSSRTTARPSQTNIHTFIQTNNSFSQNTTTGSQNTHSFSQTETTTSQTNITTPSQETESFRGITAISRKVTTTPSQTNNTAPRLITTKSSKANTTSRQTNTTRQSATSSKQTHIMLSRTYTTPRQTTTTPRQTIATPTIVTSSQNHTTPSPTTTSSQTMTTSQTTIPEQSQTSRAPIQTTILKQNQSSTASSQTTTELRQTTTAPNLTTQPQLNLLKTNWTPQTRALPPNLTSKKNPNQVITSQLNHLMETILRSASTIPQHDPNNIQHSSAPLSSDVPRTSPPARNPPEPGTLVSPSTPKPGPPSQATAVQPSGLTWTGTQQTPQGSKPGRSSSAHSDVITIHSAEPIRSEKQELAPSWTSPLPSFPGSTFFPPSSPLSPYRVSSPHSSSSPNHHITAPGAPPALLFPPPLPLPPGFSPASFSSAPPPFPQSEPAPAPLRLLPNPLPSVLTPSSPLKPDHGSQIQTDSLDSHKPLLPDSGTNPSQTHSGSESFPDPDLDPKPGLPGTNLKPKPSAPGKEGNTPAAEPGHRAWELGMLLGSWAGLGLVLVVGIRCFYQHWCGKQTELRLNAREREYDRGERGLIHVQECGDLVRVRRIRENSFVLLAGYDMLTPAEH